MKERDDWHPTDDIKHETGSGDPFAAAVRATRMPMVITDPAKPDNPIVFCNEAFQKLTGYSRDEIIGRNWSNAFIVFVTANPRKVMDDFGGAHGVIPKPFSRNGLMAAMRYIEEGVCDPPPTSPQPASFTASPAFAASWS
jgi:hypothetical protein